MFLKRVERLRPLVTSEANGLPVDIILAIIQNESGGQVGIKAKKKTRYCINLKNKSGGTTRACYALGLMQVIPKNIEGWNKKKGNASVLYENMTGKSDHDARIQIRIGISILRSGLRWLNNYDPASFPIKNISLNTMQMALIVYSWGQGRLRNNLNTLRQKGLSLTFKNIVKIWPNLGKPHNNPLFYTRKIIKNSGFKGSNYSDESNGKEKNKGGDMLILAALIIGLVILWKEKS